MGEFNKLLEKIQALYIFCKDHIHLLNFCKKCFQWLKKKPWVFASLIMVTILTISLVPLFFYMVHFDQLNNVSMILGFDDKRPIRYHPDQEYIALDNVAKDTIHDFKAEMNQSIKDAFLKQGNIEYTVDPIKDIIFVEATLINESDIIKTSLSWFALEDPKRIDKYRYRNWNIKKSKISFNCHGVFDELFEKASEEEVKNKKFKIKDYQVYLYMSCDEIKLMELVSRPQDKTVDVWVMPLSRNRRRSIGLFTIDNIYLQHMPTILNVIRGRKIEVRRLYELITTLQEIDKKVAYASRS